MQTVDKKQQLAINLIIAGVGVITAFIGVMAYRDNQKHQKVQQDLFAIDKEIKLLQLATAKDKAKENGLI
jgi:hypothetical protein